MNTFRCIAIALFLGGCSPYRSGDSTRDILSNPRAADSIVHAIVGDHELMLKMIAEIKKSDHATMMIDHLLGHADMPAMDHENCPMRDTAEAGSSAKQKSPYAGEETRRLKALSDDDINKYLSGEGMGMAKAAELNGYPGPKHALALAAAIELSASQQEKLQEAFDRMHAKAVSLGKQLVEKEEALDRLFASGKIAEETLRSLTGDLGRIAGELRAAHLRAHLATRSILSGEQVEHYLSLRGYSPAMDHSKH